MNSLNVDEILFAIQNYKINDLSNNFDTMVMSCIDYLPHQFWTRSETIKKMYNIENLTIEELNKLADIYKRAIVYGKFVRFYNLDVETNIAEYIIEYDTNFWNNEENAYKTMIIKLKNRYGDNFVDHILVNYDIINN
jgi:hypothetical protein